MATPALGTVGTAVQALGVTTLTIPFTLAAGETLFIAVNGGAASLPTVSSAVWNGSEAMTLIAAANAGNAFRSCHVFGLVGATTGTHDVVVTFGASVNAALGFAFSYSNVEPTAPWDGAQTANGNPSTTPSVTMASATGDLAVAAFLGSEAYGGHTASNGTERSEQTTANGSYVLLDRAGQTSTQINGTLGASDTWGMVGFNLNASLDVQTIPVTNANLFFSPYATYSNGGGSMASTNVKASSTYATLLTPGNYLKFKVTVASGGAGYVALLLDTSAYNGLTASTCPRVSYSYNKRPFTSALLAYSASTTALVLANGLAAGTYEFEVHFQGLGTSTAYGPSADLWTTPKYVVKTVGLSIDTTASVPSQTVASDNWLIFGASYSGGVNAMLPNNDAANDLAGPMNNARLAFPALMARGAGVEYGVVSYGGQGFDRGIGSTAASSTNPSFYNTTSANQSWDKYYSGQSRAITSPAAPKVIIVDHGFNDQGALSASTVTAVLDAIRTAVGTTAWIFVVGQACDDEAAIVSGVAAVANPTRTKYLTITDLVTDGTPSEYSGDAALGGSHPNERGHAQRAAEVLRQIQAYITGATAGYSRARSANA